MDKYNENHSKSKVSEVSSLSSGLSNKWKFLVAPCQGTIWRYRSRMLALLLEVLLGVSMCYSVGLFVLFVCRELWRLQNDCGQNGNDGHTRLQPYPRGRGVEKFCCLLLLRVDSGVTCSPMPFRRLCVVAVRLTQLSVRDQLWAESER